MGYYTSFAVALNPNEFPDRPALDRALQNLAVCIKTASRYTLEIYQDSCYCTEQCPMLTPVDEIKWYDHEDDLKSWTYLNLGITVALYGQGENFGDRWIKYFRNGTFWHRWLPIPFWEAGVDYTQPLRHQFKALTS